MKKLTRRLVSLLLAAVMILDMVPVMALAGEVDTELTLDSIAWEDLTYRDIFINNNEVYVDGFNGKSFSPFVQNTGTNTLTNEACYTGPYSLKAFGSPSQQIVSVKNVAVSGDYFLASKVSCTRYVQGTLGVCLGANSVGVTSVTDGFVTAAGIVTATTSNKAFLGSFHSADLDGYVDDPVAVSLTVFDNIPAIEQLTQLYENYVAIEKAVIREEVPFSDEEKLDAFVKYMNSKAAAIGMTGSSFNDAVGIDNKSTAYDLMQLMVYTYMSGGLENIWNAASYTAEVDGENARQQQLVSTVMKPALTDHYTVLGGKTGTLSAYDARNLAVILEIPGSDDKLAVVALYADGLDTEDENRFEAVKQIADAALAGDIDADVCCAGAIACRIPTDITDGLTVVYEKDCHTVRVPASITKVLTAVCALDIITDAESVITFNSFDTDIGNFYGNDFMPADKISFEDALYAMMLPSSNVTAGAVARNAGGIVLENNISVSEISHIHTYINNICAGCGDEKNNKETFKGKKVSILSHSMSTYAGVSNSTAANSTIGNNDVYYTEGRLGVYQKDTWWQQVIDALDMELLVNNSWSGSCILQPRKGAASVGYGDRAVNLHNDHTGQEPDIIFVYLGGNDFAYYKDTFGKAADVDYNALIADNGDGTYTYATPATTCEAYAIMLHKVATRYPDADIYCMTSTARRAEDYTGDSYPDAGQPTEYSAQLQSIATHFGYPVIDLEKAIPADVQIFDKYMGDKRAHANPLGMDQISNEVLSVMLGQAAEIRHVTATDNAVAEQAVLLGGSYSADVNVTPGYSVIVKMGGTDVTADVYKDGRISVAEVTGDIQVDTVIDRGPLNFRWELINGTLTSTGITDNAVTKLSETVTDGILYDGKYELSQPVVLKHNLPWKLEWQCAEDWRGVMFTSTTEANITGKTYISRVKGGQLCFGTWNGTQYDNYGADISYLDSQMHTYLLENRIAADGSNMAYLYVDDVEIGPMNNYYIGSKSQGTTSDWVSGKDFVFYNIGTDDHELKNCQLEYLAVTECDHIYENGICTGCGAEIPAVEWETGTIASADGLDNSAVSRARTVGYLLLKNYGGVGINSGYTMTNFVYDENYNYLGTSSWLGNGVSFTTEELQDQYPAGVYFRVVYRAVDQHTLTEEDFTDADATFYLPGEEIPEPELDYTVEDVGNIGTWQDGAIWNGKLFVFGGSGTGAVYNLESLTKISSLSLDKKDVIIPHANAVCFGSTYYESGDKYPLLYVNIYNNYASAEDRMEGTCCVYRIVETDGVFTTELVQVIEIGFTEDLTLWKSKENNGDVRPYGNFVVDTDKDKLYAFVMRDADKTTRFFSFDIPALEEGSYNSSYGCNVVTLNVTDIDTQFDTEYFNYLQGCCYSSGKIVSAESFGGDSPLRIVDLENRSVSKTFYLGVSGLTKEAEVVCVDPDTGKLYYAAADGMLRTIELDDICFHTYENGICTGCGDEKILQGKTISILGASISTYTGISDNADYNSTIGSNAVYYTRGKYGVYADDTWWMQAADDLGLELLVNNSWSGSSLLYERNGTAGAYVDRCVQLHNNDGREPDIIAIQMGTNDFQYYKDTLGTADIDYSQLIVRNQDDSYTYARPETSLEAAAIVLHKISVRYPQAEVYYLNISQRVDGTDEQIRSFNAELKQVVEHFGAHIVDIYGSAITMDDFDTYIGDGRVHPNTLGMDAYTEAFKKSLIANTDYFVNTHTVSFSLENVTADYGDDKIVVDGDSFSVKLTAADSPDVKVTMGGRDITSYAYSDGTVAIDSVTADVNITASSYHTPAKYRWEFDGTDLASTDGSNPLTKNSGTTADGVFTDTRYALASAVVLKHNLPWAVEWKSEGTFQNTGSSSGARVFSSTDVNAEYDARYIFKSNKNGIIAMGEKTSTGSHNYGIALADHDIDWTVSHTYRMENRIADDGSNMVYLMVDGEEIGAMNNYYVGTTDKNTTSDWLNGKDFVFPYMGTDTHGFTNAAIEYILVDEQHTHIYENGTCTGCGNSLKPYQRLTYFTVDVKAENGKTYTDNAVLYLPKNYSVDGEPVRLIIYCKQGSSTITSSSNPIESVGFYNYLLNLGYAILGVDGVPDAWRDELGLDETRVVGNPLAVQGTEKAYDYVIENYNIASDGCFISGYSQGGHYAQNVIDLTDIPVLAAAEQSPVCSMRYHQWDLNASQTVGGVKFTKAARLNVARIYGFPAVSSNTDLLNLAYDASLVDDYDPWVRNSRNVYTGFVQKSNLWYLPAGTTLDDIKMTHTAKCPVKIWCAEDDSAVSADVMRVFVKAIQNAGGKAEISVSESGGHGFFQKQAAVGTFTENGKNYNTLPIAVEIAQWFEQYGGYECHHSYQNGVCTICGDKKGAAISRADDQVYYDSITEAMESAQTGDTVKLLADTESFMTNLYQGITLDLNGYTLETDYFVAFNGNNIIDSSEDNSGLLVVAEDRFAIANNSQLPVKTTDGYKFYEVLKINEKAYTGDQYGKYVFQPIIEPAVHQELLKGMEATDVQIIVDVTYKSGDDKTGKREFVYSDSFVETFVNSYNAETGKYSKMFSLTISDADKFESLTFTTRVVFADKVEFASPLA